MKIPLFLAMAAPELAGCGKLPDHTAWLACHFSPSGSALSNIPAALPAESLLILDDSIPFHQHHPQAILQQLENTISKLQIQGIVLDFQRSVTLELRDLTQLLQNRLACPVAAPPAYSNTTSPLFLPPVPLHQTPQKYLSPYHDREIWLETALDTSFVHIHMNGCHIEPEPHGTTYELPRQSPHFFAHYRVSCHPEKVVLQLQRTRQDLAQLSEEVSHLGVTRLIGLWQELK